MFFAKWDQGGPWNYDGIKGPQRLLNDIWDAGDMPSMRPARLMNRAGRALQRKTHQVVRKVSEDMESFSFNTAVAAIMELRNALLAAQRDQNVSEAAWDEAIDKLLLFWRPSPRISPKSCGPGMATLTASTSRPGLPGMKRSPGKSRSR